MKSPEIDLQKAVDSDKKEEADVSKEQATENSADKDSRWGLLYTFACFIGIHLLVCI